MLPKLLEGVVEYRYCKEVTPALRILTFDGSIEHIKCIPQHNDFSPMTHRAVLENVGPLLRDKNGCSYKRRTVFEPVSCNSSFFYFILPNTQNYLQCILDV